jgi:GSH-dependent disulfide-bond oxidoreductase
MSLTAYICGGPNPRKVTILLQELGLPYETRVIDMYEGEHRSAEFLRVNPNGRLPALHDTEGPEGPFVLYESGAILQYLAEKMGRLLPTSGARRYEVLKWLHLQVSLAPYLGQAHLYRVMYREAMPFDIRRFTIEAKRIYDLVDTQLARSRHIADDELSIADIAWYPWLQYHRWQGQHLTDFPHISRWMTMLEERPAVRRGASLPWPYTECGPSAAGARALALITARLADPEFTLRASESDAAMANLGI